jgi:hypothetical protein
VEVVVVVEVRFAAVSAEHPNGVVLSPTRSARRPQ